MRLLPTSLVLVLGASACESGCRPFGRGGDERWERPQGPDDVVFGEARDGGWGEAVAAPDQAPTPIRRGHPRLWIRQADLPRLRRWATRENPVWQRIEELTDKFLREWEGKQVGGDDCTSPSGGFCETYAELFAFRSLMAEDEGERRAWAERAKAVLFLVIDGKPRGREFIESSRARWAGEAFPLTVDWIYGYLTKEERGRIRKVLLGWNETRLRAERTTFNHPEPAGKTWDPALLEKRNAVRHAGNNYYAAHMRNNCLNALAYDDEDDPGGELRAFVENSIGAWLYTIDYLWKTDARGGVMPEGLEYAPQTMGYIAEMILALHTAGETPERGWGPLISFTENPYWDQLLDVIIHQAAPAPRKVDGREEALPAWFGDGQTYAPPQMIESMGPLGIDAMMAGDRARLDKARWIQLNLSRGGPEGFPRVFDAPRDLILAFLLFDPEAPPPPDPRGKMEVDHYAPGLGHLYARTGWGRDATYFTFKNPWMYVDHQHAEAGEFDFFRGGEWLTREWTGYGDTVLSSEYHNTIAIENSRPYHHEPGDARTVAWTRGSQYGDSNATWDRNTARVLQASFDRAYAYALGISTTQYNSSHEQIDDVKHVSRSIVWLRPDHIVVFDRLETKSEGRFKRFWLNTTAPASIEGRRASVSTPGGQKLYLTSLLPERVKLSTDDGDRAGLKDEPAHGVDLKGRIKVEAEGAPREVRFLHVVQGADGGAAADPAQLLAAGEGWAGAAVRGVAVLFPAGTNLKQLRQAESIAYRAPAGTKAHVVTGLLPKGSYDVQSTTEGGEVRVTVKKDGPRQADEGGVLAWGF